MKTPILSSSMRRFFEVEIRNEEPLSATSHGGAKPAYLASASSSLFQAPTDVLADWCEWSGLRPHKFRGRLENEMKELIAEHGPRKELRDLLG
jgi:hypothetical protein